MPPPLLVLLASVAVVASAVDAQADPTESSISFRPSVAIVIGIFAIMFSLTFLLLIYAKFCHGRGGRGGAHLFFRYAGDSADDVFMPSGGAGGTASSSRGVDKAVVESLPFFRFSALRGKRDGLECAVCLSKFLDADVLRLLPRCKHAFHVGCVDRWLESRSTCPLCRYRIDPDDAATLRCSSSSRRLLFRDGSSNRAANDDDDDIGNRSSSILELFVEREPDKLLGGVDKREELLLPPPNDVALLHRHKHKIVTSGAVFKSRWSDLNSSDFLSLDSEMLLSMVISNRHFPDSSPDKEELGEKRLLENNKTTGNRCMSAMTSVSRFRSSGSTGDDDDDKVRRLWLPIAQRTVQLFAGGREETGTCGQHE